MEFVKRHYVIVGTILFDLFLLWVILRFNLGGWQRAVSLYSHGLTTWTCVIVVIAFLTLFKSDFRTDFPLFLAALLLGYWGEWWGTTRGVWTYPTKETPPISIVFFWGICLLAVYHLHFAFRWKGKKKGKQKEEKRRTPVKALILVVFPLMGLALTWKGVIRVDWVKYLDIHPIAAVLVCSFLILRDVEPYETFCIFVSGTLVGGLLEYWSISAGSYRYITGEGMPLLIAPLWGIACVAMVKLGYLIRDGFSTTVCFLRSKGSPAKTGFPKVSSSPNVQEIDRESVSGRNRRQ